MRHLLALSSLVLCAACAHDTYRSTGAVALNGTSAGFNETSVVGPNVNVSRRSDGSWGGLLYNQPVDLSVTEDSIRGASLQLSVQRWNDMLRISGLWFNSMVRAEVTPTRIRLQVAGNGSEYVLRPDGTWQGTSGAIPYALQLTGEAAGVSQPMPQFALALLAAGTNSTNRGMLPGPAPHYYFGPGR